MKNKKWILRKKYNSVVKYQDCGRHFIILPDKVKSGKVCLDCGCRYACIN